MTSLAGSLLDTGVAEIASPRGAQIFGGECARCYVPPALTGPPVPLAVVGTDPTLGLSAARGTGFYRVPSLHGVGSRGPLLHDGTMPSVAAMLDPTRPTPAFTQRLHGPGPIAGHPFGLELSQDDRTRLSRSSSSSDTREPIGVRLGGASSMSPTLVRRVGRCPTQFSCGAPWTSASVEIREAQLPAYEAGERARSRRRLTACTMLGIAVGVALGAGRTAHAADVAVSDEARTHFQAGVALLQDPKAPRYEEAYREFKAAYAISPSYKILSNLGLCAMKIERDKEAINAYETYLKEAGPEATADERAQIDRDLLTLRTGLVLVTVSSDPAGATIVDVRTPVQGSEIRNSYGDFLTPRELGLRHGHHTIIARLHGYLDQQWEFEASGSAMSPHVFHMERPPSNVVALVRERPIPSGALAAGIITLGLAGTGTVLGIAALQKHNDFTSLNDGTNPSAAESAKDSGQTLNIATDAMFGAAIAGAVVTTLLFVSRPTIEQPASPQLGLLPRSVTPTWTPQGGGASATWIF